MNALLLMPGAVRPMTTWETPLTSALRTSGIVNLLPGPNVSMNSVKLPTGVGSSGPRSVTPTTPRMPVMPEGTGAGSNCVRTWTPGITRAEGMAPTF